MSKWKEYRLFELGKVVTGNTPSSKFPEEFGSDMPFITPSDYKNYNKWIETADRNLSAKGIDKLRNRILPKKSLLVTCIGSDMGKVAMNKIPVISNQQINSIIPNEYVDADFLYYKLVEIYDVLRIYGEAGTAVPIVNKTDFENIEIEIPSGKGEQTAIAEALSSLDDKIDLLHRQNKTLEQLAETLFRQWFVEEAEEGWDTDILENIIDLQRGISYSGSSLGEKGDGVPMHNLNSIDISGSYKYDGIKYYKGEIKEKQLLKPGDLLIINTDITQDNRIIGWPIFVPEEFSISISTHHLYSATLKDSRVSRLYLYYLLRHRDYRETLANASNGTTVSMLSKDAIGGIEVRIPRTEVRLKFEEQAISFQNKQTENQKHIRTLTQIRDTLLPKLMSGEVRVNNVSSKSL